MPYNFGHTVEEVAAAGSSSGSGASESREEFFAMRTLATNQSIPADVRLEEITEDIQPGGEVWGTLYPRLTEINDHTGCMHAYSPPKFWPQDLAEEYFGNKTRFAIIRDPYERLVAEFRGALGSAVDLYGLDLSAYHDSCDVNGAIREMLARFAADRSLNNCAMIPQAESFEGPWGVQLAVDNRRFPSAFNELMRDHGYGNVQAAPQDVLHVGGCDEHWSAQLDCETRRMVQEVYADDFRLLCERFGYCDLNENSCLTEIDQMCPQNHMVGNHSNCSLANSPVSGLGGV